MVKQVLSVCGISILSTLISTNTVQAGIEFTDDFNSYSDSAALRTAWPNTASGNYVPDLISSSGNSYLVIRNGIVSKDIGTTITTSWTLTFNGMQGANSRGLWAALTDSTGTKGYGILWDSGGNGIGSIQIRKFDMASTIGDWGATGSGTQLKSGTGNQAINTTPFAALELSWDKTTGTLTAKENGSTICTIADTSFNQFSRIYLRGNGGGGVDVASFDNIQIATVPEAASISLLALGAVALLRRHK